MSRRRHHLEPKTVLIGCALTVLAVATLVVGMAALKTPHVANGGKVVGYTPPKPQPTGLPVVALGDSITQMDSVAATGVLGHSWFANLVQMDTKLQYVWNAGLGGDTTAAMLARIDRDVIAHKPAVAFVMGGTNDLGKVDEATTITNLTAIIDKLTAAKIRVVLFSINPRADQSFAPQIASLNVAIQQLAATKGIGFVNTHDAVSTPAGTYRPGLSSDGTHPTIAGQQAMADAALPQLAKLGF